MVHWVIFSVVENQMMDGSIQNANYNFILLYPNE